MIGIGDSLPLHLNWILRNRNLLKPFFQVADLREFEEFTEYFPDLEAYPLYQSALRQLENGGIPCRTLRTDVVKCGTDGEFLAKLHCLRLAFQQILRDDMTYIWFVDAGRQILADLLLYADKDPKDFLIGKNLFFSIHQFEISNGTQLIWKFSHDILIRCWRRCMVIPVSYSEYTFCQNLQSN